jgi:ABC-2 type transport system ATP-binding protein
MSQLRTPQASDLAVVTSGLTKRFGDRVVVDHVDLRIPTGSVCGFVGPNGAGKTTTIRMLLGLITPTEGTGTLLGGDLSRPASYLHRVGALIEAPAFYPQLSGRDNLLTLARLGGIDLSAIAAVLEQVGLVQRSLDLYRRYSLGMKQRLGLAAALLASPDLLILDEPTNGLDPAGIVEMRDLIRSLADGGMTVFVSSHLLAEIGHICDHLVMISDGQIVFQGDVATLQAARSGELVLRPDVPEQLSTLLVVVQQAGFSARLDDEPMGTPVVVVDAGGDLAGQLNRLCMDGGVVLRQISERTGTLEQAFFELTGSQSRDVVPTHSLAGVH